MYHWTENMVRFMVDASEHTEYYAALSDKIAEFLPADGHICDAGCGLGHLSVELSKRFRWVSSVDIAPQAVEVLRRQIEQKKITNITPLCGDIFRLPPAQPYDGMVFCLFGEIGQILRIAGRQCSGKIVIIKKNYDAHRFSMTNQPLRHHTFAQSVQFLEEIGIPYHAEPSRVELGQPFRSMEDAVTFFQTYSRDEDPSCITADSIRGRLIETGDAEFPYYLPENKKMSILVLDVRDIPQEWKRKELKTDD